MYNPLVSIVIPVYNGENYLEKAIVSALNQTYKNIEIIVINDGSKDNTEKIALKYSDRIRYIKKENGGVATALNLALSNMKGDYFSWLSHDDEYTPRKIEEQIQYIIENDLIDKKVILYSDYSLIDTKSNIFANCEKNHLEILTKPEYSLLRGHVNGITMLIPRQAFDDYGQFDVTLKCAQDYDLWWKMFQGYEFIHMCKILSCTRIHDQQDTKKSENTTPEGNALWIQMMDDVSDERKKWLEGSLIQYYEKMRDFLVNTPYVLARNHAEKKINELSESFSVFSVNEKNIKVSVVIPFFNRLEKLFASLDSVLKQTYSNIEIILVNDCSTVNLNQLYERYINVYGNIRIINLEKNSGPAKARNVGMDEAKGQYIAFLDSDDCFVPEKIEKQLKYMLFNNSLYSHTSYIRRGFGNDQVMESGLTTGHVVSDLVRSCQIATPTVMVNKEFIDSYSLRYREDLRIGEDVCFWISIAKKTPFLGINEPLTIVNASEDSAAYNDEKLFSGVKGIFQNIIDDEELDVYSESTNKLLSFVVHMAVKTQGFLQGEKELVEVIDEIKHRKVHRIIKQSLYKSLKANTIDISYVNYCDYCINLYSEKINILLLVNEINSYHKMIKNTFISNSIECNIAAFNYSKKGYDYVFLGNSKLRERFKNSETSNIYEAQIGLSYAPQFRNSDFIIIDEGILDILGKSYFASIVDCKKTFVVTNNEIELKRKYSEFSFNYFFDGSSNQCIYVLDEKRLDVSDYYKLALSITKEFESLPYSDNMFQTRYYDVLSTTYKKFTVFSFIRNYLREQVNRFRNHFIIVKILTLFALFKETLISLKNDGLVITLRRIGEYLNIGSILFKYKIVILSFFVKIWNRCCESKLFFMIVLVKETFISLKNDGVKNTVNRIRNFITKK